MPHLAGSRIIELYHRQVLDTTQRSVWAWYAPTLHSATILWLPGMLAGERELQNNYNTLLQPGIFRSGGVCPLLGGILQLRSAPRISRPFPGQPTGWHHAASCLAISIVACQ